MSQLDSTLENENDVVEDSMNQEHIQEYFQKVKEDNSKKTKLEDIFSDLDLGEEDTITTSTETNLLGELEDEEDSDDVLEIPSDDKKNILVSNQNLEDY